MVATLMRFRLLFLFVLLAFAVSPGFGKGIDIQFHGTVTRVDLTSTPSITVRVEGFDLKVLLNSDTEVEFHGDEVELADIKVGNFVKISGFFATSGITAQQIQIIDRGDGEFRLHGQITAVRQGSGGPIITLLGIEVLVDSNTKIERRGPAGGFTPANLIAGLMVDATGLHRDSQFIASRVKVGNREDDAIRVEFNGKITVVATDRVTVDTEAGSSAVVLITSTTIVTGKPAVGQFAEVRGTLNSSLQVVATRINVKASRDSDDDDVRPPSTTRFEKKISLLPVGQVSSVRGSASVEYLQISGTTQQELEIDFEHAQANTDYSVRIDIQGAAVSLGTVRTNRDGRAELNFAAPAHGRESNLAPILPAGKTVRDITKVQILNSAGTVVAEGQF